MISTTCNIVNSVDKCEMTLCTTWSNAEVKIIIIRNEFPPLIGEKKIADLTKIAGNFRISEDEYLTEIQHELSGQADTIVFSLKDNVFSWKKKIWIRGKIDCKLLEKTQQLSKILLEILVKNSVSQEAARKVTEENEILKKRVEDMEVTLREMTRIKNEMEDELYKNFIILLNTKKRKIRQLKERISDLLKNPAYDMVTDESDSEVVNDQDHLVPQDPQEAIEKNNVNINDHSDDSEGPATDQSDSEVVHEKDNLVPQESIEKNHADINDNLNCSGGLDIFSRISKSYGIPLSDVEVDDDNSIELRLSVTPEIPKKRSPIELCMDSQDSEDDLFS